MSGALKCEPCGKNFTGHVSYQQHLESLKHQKKVSVSSFFNGSNSVGLQSANQIPSSGLLNNAFECSACGLVFNSAKNFQIHSLSLEHAQKVLEKTGMESDVTSSSNYKSNSSDKNIVVDCEAANENMASGCEVNGFDKNITVDENDSIIPETEMFKSQTLLFSSCTTCNKCFSGPEPYMQHMESAAHKKKVNLEKHVLFNDKTNQKSSEFSCKPCNKIFSGQIPLIQHMESEIHKKKLLNLQYCGKSEIDSITGINDLKKEDLLQKNPQVLICDVCNVPCSGIVSYKQHLEGTSHLKKIKAQKLISDFVSGISVDRLTQGSNQEKLQKEFSMEENNLQITNKNLQEVELIPGLIDEMKNIHTENLEESVTIFLPDEPIDFNGSNSKTNSNAAEKNIPDISKQIEEKIRNIENQYIK